MSEQVEQENPLRWRLFSMNGSTGESGFFLIEKYKDVTFRCLKEDFKEEDIQRAFIALNGGAVDAVEKSTSKD